MMREQMAAQGIVLRGFERVDDGIQVTGFELDQPTSTRQLGLFGGLDAEGTER